MKENKKNQPVFGTAVNTDKKAGGKSGHYVADRNTDVNSSDN